MNKWVKYTVSGIILLMFLVGLSSNLSAAESEATITFEEDTSIPEILDPVDPEQTIDPEEGKTDESGPLSLDYVPKIEFGSNPFSLTDKTYDSTTVKPFIQVTDKRADVNETGWHVKVSAEAFTSTTSDDSLVGAVLTFSNAEVLTRSDYEDFEEPTPVNPVVVSTDGIPSLVVWADANEGRGSWITRWFPDGYNPASPPEFNNNVTLTVPGGEANLETYSSTLTWILENGPQS